MIKIKLLRPLLMLVLAPGASIFAATFTVTNVNDTGVGSLRNAITLANTTPGTDTIDFNITGSGVHTITPATLLPSITDPVIIDGYTQTGASANTLAVGDNAHLRIQLDGSAVGNNFGLAIAPGGSGSTIRGLIINNFSPGIFLSVGSQAGSSNNVIEGNFIGVDATGTTAVGNGTAVGTINSTNNTIGGTAPAARNVLVGAVGVDLNISNGNAVQGNYICLNAAGTAGLSCGTGISIEQDSSNNTIGGSAVGAGNVIGTPIQFGIWMSASGSNNVGNNVIQGNFIGTDATGTGALGAGSHGILVEVKPNSNNLIGGTNAGEGNVIAFNGGSGVILHNQNGNASGVRIEGNSIFSNGGLGIDLGADGVTQNDAGDADVGVNDLQNFPVITSVTYASGMMTIKGTLNSTASTMYRIEFFANDSVDANGFGEGKTFAGFVNATTNGSGNVSFTKIVPQVAGQPHITATATDPNGNTSEFSAAFGQLINISTRENVLTGNSVMIGGFIVGGDGNLPVILRALGPTLQNFGINNFLADPTLDLFDGANNLIMSNDNWKDSQMAAIMATGKAPPNDAESAIVHTFAPGNYTGIVRGKNSTTGVALFEAYDLDDTLPVTLTNISTRGFVDVNQNVMIGGFVLGNGFVPVLVRALGPTLQNFGVTNVLADPLLEIHDAQGTLLVSNDNWKDTQQAAITATGKAPPNDAESAIIITRPSGNTTAIVRGVNNTTGNALVEVYLLPP